MSHAVTRLKAALEGRYEPSHNSARDSREQLPT